MDREGSRHGSISVVALHVLPAATMYLIDTHVLGAAAFSTEGPAKQSFKVILESERIPKAIFDFRNDSDALYSLFPSEARCPGRAEGVDQCFSCDVLGHMSSDCPEGVIRCLICFKLGHIRRCAGASCVIPLDT